MSFAKLLEFHERLNELFLLHQEALLRLDLDLAAERLRIYERELRAHMRVEEDLLMPVYERAGRIAGGPQEFFIGEQTPPKLAGHSYSISPWPQCSERRWSSRSNSSG